LEYYGLEYKYITHYLQQKLTYEEMVSLMLRLVRIRLSPGAATQFAPRGSSLEPWGF
jgi:hypothetical protein